jgi:hypothetical protein
VLLRAERAVEFPVAVWHVRECSDALYALPCHTSGRTPARLLHRRAKECWQQPAPRRRASPWWLLFRAAVAE